MVDGAQKPFNPAGPGERDRETERRETGKGDKMDANHTPGPWTIERDRHRDESLGDQAGFEIRSVGPSRKFRIWAENNKSRMNKDFAFDGPFTVAEVHGWWNGSGDDCGPVDGLVGNDEIEANARLIAAAPELLAALKRVAVFLADNYTDEDCTFAPQVRAAIAKAEGR